MPLSRELANKKNDHKDRQSRGRANSTPTDMKKGGAGAHNWGIVTEEEPNLTALDKQDPNYDSSDEASKE
uniref:Hyaluronan/mRNA-binding protein domain-containing protein n=1 Tax=Globisporangium ultimum (strain ATCC 200006 / CBS 805.95 / DAOM BR144) TaxID=431595 RepID=K3X7X9_GLOUD